MVQINMELKHKICLAKIKKNNIKLLTTTHYQVILTLVLLKKYYEPSECLNLMNHHNGRISICKDKETYKTLMSIKSKKQQQILTQIKTIDRTIHNLETQVSKLTNTYFCCQNQQHLFLLSKSTALIKSRKVPNRLRKY